MSIVASYLLDTNHISPLVTLEHPLRLRIVQDLQGTNTFGIATPALTEFLFGVSLLPRAKQNLEEWERLNLSFTYYDVRKADAELAAHLRVALRRQGQQLATVDALIAAIALRNDLTLLTKDSDFSAVPGIRQENWLPT